TDASKWDAELRGSIDRLPGDDRRLAVAYLDRTKSAATLGGQAIPGGVTLGQAVDHQRAFEQSQAQQRLTNRAQQEQQDQQQKNADKQAAEVFAITLTNKEI